MTEDWNAVKAEFLLFIAALKVATKNYGIVSLGKALYNAQSYLIDEIFSGLADGIHHFVILKGRQAGISTLCLALDLYWHFKFDGTEGTLAADTDSNSEMFRETLNGYMKSLPVKWKQIADPNNRTMIGFANRSRMIYQVAGQRKKRGFGAGKAVMYIHATEVGLWGDVDLPSLEASFSQKNPRRLYIFESTAYGYNAFYDMWEMAETANSRKPIFIGWWRVDDYRCEKDSDQYRVYWDGTLTNDEQGWWNEVKELYDYEISDEQMAWWRWTFFEQCHEDIDEMHEKYPPTAEHAFRMTGSQFFSGQKLSDCRKIVEKKPFDIRRFHFGAAFGDTELIECNERTATLKIWQPPERKGVYAIGADPAWGSSEWADRFCINVTRCWADQVEQVAEFCTPDINTAQFAWVLLYLAGAYCDKAQQQVVMINLELNGPGQAVWQEIQTLKRNAFMMKEQANIAQLLMNIQNFLYKKIDAIHGSYNYHTLTSTREKERYMNTMKDKHEMGQLTINSADCLDEMKNVVREDGMLGVPGRGKDDRVISQALAVMCWTDFLQMPLIQSGMTKAKSEAEARMPREHVTAGRNVDNYLKQLGINLKKEPAR